MSETTTPSKDMPILEALAILDGALTITDRILAYANDKRMRGELTPEEEAALDARQEAMFASPAWKKSKP
jgi:hypothetical protein